VNDFNFLERAPVSFAARFSEFELTPNARRALLGLLFAVILLAVAMGIERIRFSRALEAAQREEARLLRADESVRTLRTSIETVSRMSAIAKRVHEVRQSGAGRAKEIAAIAAEIPNDAWLTSLARDDAGVTLKGGARDFEALGRAVASLSADRTFAAPELVSSRLRDPERFAGSTVEFELHMRERAR
jgi:Tfp pilus assembly protein PilN